jgi:2-succinyl-6-hydroxy-2,4-cyclohexadiene-1-carboxylate synthase
MSSAVSHFVDAGDVTLHALAEGSGRPVVLLHGFTGSCESMAGVAQLLGEGDGGWRRVRIDLVGHGRSQIPKRLDAYSMPRCVEQVRAVLDALELERPHLLGYSMGARAALSLCASYPDRVSSALLVGARAGIRDSVARRERVRADQALAERILGDGIEAFVDHWMALPLFASQKRLGAEALAAARAQRLRCSPEGLSGSLRGMGAGAQPPLHDRLHRVRLPVCLVVGEEDRKFCEIAADLAARLPDARLQLLAAAGHAAHLENPTGFRRVADRFFREVDASVELPTPPPEPSPAQPPKEASA